MTYWTCTCRTCSIKAAFLNRPIRSTCTCGNYMGGLLKILTITWASKRLIRNSQQGRKRELTATLKKILTHYWGSRSKWTGSNGTMKQQLGEPVHGEEFQP